MDVKSVYKKLFAEFGPQHWWPTLQNVKHETQNTKQFEICVGAILTQNTAWKNVEKAIVNLCSSGAMRPEAILRMRTAKLASLIRPAGYFNQKAKKLKIFSKWVLRNRGPAAISKKQAGTLRDELLSIWGIGPETADSIVLYAFGKPSFVVDAYTRRLCACFDKNFENYDECKNFFESGLPQSSKLYNEYHALIVAWGKMLSRDRARALKILSLPNVKNR